MNFDDRTMFSISTGSMQLGCTCPQGGWHSIAPPPPCPVHLPLYRVAVGMPIDAPPISDANAERIARCVADLLTPPRPVRPSDPVEDDVP